MILTALKYSKMLNAAAVPCYQRGKGEISALLDQNKKLFCTQRRNER